MCKIKDCHSPVYQKGWCSMHYARWYKHGTPKYEKCGRSGCYGLVKIKGLCYPHYQEDYREKKREPTTLEVYWQPSGSTLPCPVCKKAAIHLEPKKKYSDPPLSFCGTCLKVITLDEGETVTLEVLGRVRRERKKGIYECMTLKSGLLS